MKNQYFGDTRDLFKYDLAMHCMARTGLRRFIFIPMLTPDDGSADGAHVDLRKGRAGTRNRPLVDFLEACTRNGRRDVRELDAFFEGTPYELVTHHPVLEEDKRMQYFLGLPDLEDAVVVVDPDNGMEVPSGRGPKWLRYDELRYLNERLGERSLLLVFQFIPRVRREVFVPGVARRMVERGGVERVWWVTDGHVVFYGISRRGEAWEVLGEYGGLYGLVTGAWP